MDRSITSFLFPLLGILQGILPIVIISIIVTKHNKAKKEREAAEERWEKEEQIRVAEERMRIAEETRRRQEEEHQTKVNSLVEKYKNNIYAIESAQKFAEEFIKKVKALKRDIREEKVEYCKSMGAIFRREENCCTGMGYVSAVRREHNFSFYYEKGYDSRKGYAYSDRDLIDFVEKNIRPLQSREEMDAFVRAVALNTQGIIEKQYTKDESGTEYQITTEELSGSERKIFGISIIFKYSAPNGFYTPSAEW